MGSWNGIPTLGAGAYPKAGELESITDFLTAAPEPVARSKASSEIVSSSTTLQDDDDLFWPVTSGGIYLVDIRGFYTSGTTPDFKGGWSYPTGSTIRWGGLASDTAGAITIIGNLTETQTMIAAGSGADLYFNVCGRVVAGADGTLKFQWAQNSSFASNTTLYAGSHGYLTRIA